MKTNLPNRDKAYIPKEKLRNYLLSETHAVGREKARYFRSIGYTAENAEELEEAFLMIARTESIAQEVASDFGIKYIVNGELAAPVGTRVQVRTIWVIDSQDERPRFVTAYPA
jgi:hypothetical protein